MHGPWFAALSMFVAINTVLYLTLAIIKLLPKAYLSDWVDQRNRRSEISQHLPGFRKRARRSGVGVEPTQPWATRPDRL